MSKVVALNPRRTITVHFYYAEEVRELAIEAKSKRYGTEPELLIVETLSGGTVEWPLECVLQVFDEPA